MYFILKAEDMKDTNRSFVILSDKFTYQFRCDERREVSDTWGYRFNVLPIQGLSWRNEKEGTLILH